MVGCEEINIGGYPLSLLSGGVAGLLEEEVMSALLSHAGSSTTFTIRPIEIIKTLGWSEQGYSNARLMRTMRSLANTRVTFEKSNLWFDKASGTWTNVSFSPLPLVLEHETKRGVLSYEITLSEVLSTSIALGYTYTFSLEHMKLVKSQVAKRCVRFFSRQSQIHAWTQTYDLAELVRVLGVSIKTRYSSNAKQKLNSVFEELERVGFLVPAPEDARYQSKGRRWKVTIQMKHPSIEPPAPSISTSVEKVASLLMEHGVSPSVARGLASNHPEEYIHEKIELTEKAARERKITRTRSGFLVAAIKGDFSIKNPQEERPTIRLDNPPRTDLSIQKTGVDPEAVWLSMSPDQQSIVMNAVHQRYAREILEIRKNAEGIPGKPNFAKLVVKAGLDELRNRYIVDFMERDTDMDLSSQ